MWSLFDDYWYILFILIIILVFQFLFMLYNRRRWGMIERVNSYSGEFITSATFHTSVENVGAAIAEEFNGYILDNRLPKHMIFRSLFFNSRIAWDQIIVLFEIDENTVKAKFYLFHILYITSIVSFLLTKNRYISGKSELNWKLDAIKKRLKQ